MDEIVNNPSVALLGLGEAGTAIACDLIEAGVAVSGWDPAGPPEAAPRLHFAPSATAAVAGADFVLNVNSAAVAAEVAREVAGALADRAIFADLNTAAPDLKRELAGIVEAGGARFADVALLAPVPGRGLRTPALVAGSGATDFVATFGSLGMPSEALGAQAGEAAERKLLRSVFVKGMAIAAVEALAAARAAGCEQWLHEQLLTTLSGADEALLERWLGGSRTHAARRVEEMEASGEMLESLGAPARIAGAARGWFEQLAAENAAAAAKGGARAA